MIERKISFKLLSSILFIALTHVAHGRENQAWDQIATWKIAANALWHKNRVTSHDEVNVAGPFRQSFWTKHLKNSVKKKLQNNRQHNPNMFHVIKAQTPWHKLSIPSLLYKSFG